MPKRSHLCFAFGLAGLLAVLLAVQRASEIIAEGATGGTVDAATALEFVDERDAQWNVLYRADPDEVAKPLEDHATGDDDLRAHNAWLYASYLRLEGMSKDAKKQVNDTPRGRAASIYLLGCGEKGAMEAALEETLKVDRLTYALSRIGWWGRYRNTDDVEVILEHLKAGSFGKDEDRFIAVLGWQMQRIGASTDELVKDWRKLAKEHKNVEKTAEKKRKGIGTYAIENTIELGTGEYSKFVPTDCALTPDGSRLVVQVPKEGSHGKGDTVIIDTATGETVRRIKPQDQISSFPEIAISHDGKRLALSRNESVHFYDLATGEETGTFALPADSISQVAFMPDGDSLFVIRTDTKACLVSIESGEVQKEITLPVETRRSHAKHPVVFPDGKHFAYQQRLWDGKSKVHEASVWVIEVESGDVTAEIKLPTDSLELLGTRDGGKLLSVDKRYGTIGMAEYTTTLYDAETGEPVRGVECLRTGRWGLSTRLGTLFSDEWELSWNPNSWGLLADVETGREMYRFVPPYRSVEELDEISGMAISTDRSIVVMLMRTKNAKDIQDGQHRVHIWRKQ